MGHYFARLTLLGSWHVFLWCCQTAFTGPSRAESRSSSACTPCRVRERRKTDRGKGLDKQLNPQITLRITQAASASEVLGVVREQQRKPKMDFIAVSAAWQDGKPAAQCFSRGSKGLLLDGVCWLDRTDGSEGAGRGRQECTCCCQHLLGSGAA